MALQSRGGQELRLELRKLWPSKVEGVKNSQKQATKCYKTNCQTLKKKSLYVALSLLEFKDDL
jgi:hypothetical protein